MASKIDAVPSWVLSESFAHPRKLSFKGGRIHTFFSTLSSGVEGGEEGSLELGVNGGALGSLKLAGASGKAFRKVFVGLGRDKNDTTFLRDGDSDPHAAE